MGQLEDAVADAVLEKFEPLPRNSKPDEDGKGIRNWVPLSGIVLALGNGRRDCVALATGMKCLPATQVPSANGFVLHDSHAEVLALRLFNLFLLHETESLLHSNSPSPYLRRREEREITDDRFQPFTLHDDLEIYMYSSEAPCGDASMELTMRAQEDATPWPVARRPVDAVGVPSLHGRGFFSELGAVRCKPGRADSPKTLSKSCSDKLALKQATSLLTSLTSTLIFPENAYLKSLILPGSEYIPGACERSFSATGRLRKVAHRKWRGGYAFHPFEIQTTTREFPFSRRKASGPGIQPKSSNKSALWTSRVQQVVVNGVLQGRKQTDIRGASVASRLNLGRTLAAIASTLTLSRFEQIASAKTYAEAKQSKLLEERRRVKQAVLDEALTGWIPNVADDFALSSVDIG